jgi:hypothetical protein
VSGLDHNDDDGWLDRVPWGCAWVIAVPVAVGGLVGASVIGNKVNMLLPGGFGLVGILVAVCIMGAILSLLFAPANIRRVARSGLRRRPRRPPTA